MFNVRIQFEKKGGAAYISHLDLMKTLQRALLRAQLPVEIKRAQELLAAREKFVDEAKRDVDRMMRQAELDAKTIVSESETIQLARQKSSEIIRRAEDRSKELYHVANTYTEDALRRTEEAIQAALSEVQESRARFRATSQELMQEQRAQLNASASQPAKSGGEEGQR